MKFVRFLVLLTASYCLLTTGTVLAHGDKIFEYAPDAWQSTRLSVADGATPYLLFNPPADFAMTSLDLWLDNPGSSGPVTFSLRNDNDVVLATKTATITTIPMFPGGNKFHVDWSAAVNLLAAQTYTLKIDSSVGELGLYYADRISLVEHNRDYPAPYASGAARLGSVIQNYTFKFALYQTSASGGSVPAPAETPVITPTSTEISISGARIVSVTDTTALLAWSSNIAADSTVSVRTQLSPLYVVASGYDPTLELEHTVLVTGLHASINYFANVFSSNGESLTLTTYTLSFRTLSASSAPAPNPTPPPTTPPPPPPAAPPTTQQPPSQQPANQNQNQPPAGLSANPGGDGSVDLNWNTPAAGEPSNGYRIDVFDYNYRLQRQISVPASPSQGGAGGSQAGAANAHSQTINGLSSGTDHAIVYADENGVFTKVAPPKDFTVTVGAGGIVNKIIFISLGWIVGLGGYFYWKSRIKSAKLGNI